MHIAKLHNWDVSPEQALEIQHNLAQQVILYNAVLSPRFIAGLDVSVNKANEAVAVAVVLNYPELNVVETAVAKGKVSFPYIPGLLSFREVPLTIEAFAKLSLDPDLVMVDGQGIAHPRRIGLASHLGLVLNKPTIGCAKSPLFGVFKEPENEAARFTNIEDKDGHIIGAVVRTRTGVKPLFISIGHKIDLPSAVRWVLKCCRNYRLPEPTRQAHLASRGNI
jgi:deoxyribonuclease V